MFQKLEYYTLLRTSNSLKTSFLERTRFFMGKKDRDKFLRKLQDCTKKLDKLIKRVEKEARGVHLDHSRISTVRNARAQSATTLSLKVRSLIAKLYNTLGDCWNCTCNAEHKIRLRLSERGYPRDETDVALEFIAFVKLPDSSCWWQEAKILVTPNRYVNHCNTTERTGSCSKNTAMRIPIVGNTQRNFATYHSLVSLKTA